MFWKRKSNTRRQTLCRYCILTQRNNRPKYFIAGTCLVFNSTSQSFAALTSQLSSLTLEAEIYRWESNTKAAGFFLKKLNILCPRPVVRKKERFFFFCGYFFCILWKETPLLAWLQYSARQLFLCETIQTTPN